MHKNLSIFNSKNLPCAFLLSLFFICCIEFIAYHKFNGKFFNHEVDEILNQLENKTYDKEIILIGDSVGRQVSRQFSNDHKFAMLATNQAIEMTGQYFLIKRYLYNNAPPKAVVFVGLPFIESKNLNQVYTENFVLRTFIKIEEITDIFSTKRDVTMLAKMLSYKLLFSYKYRLQLQNKILGYTNANIYSGIDKKSSSIMLPNHSLIKKLDAVKENRNGNSAIIHFTKLLRLLHSKNINFHYIPVPIKSSENSLVENYERFFQLHLYKLSKEFSNMSYLTSYGKYQDTFFMDSVHFNEKGLNYANTIIRENMSKFIERSNVRFSLK